MLSSTSSSESRHATRAIAALLIGLSLYGLALEGAARFAFARISRIRRRVERDMQAARTLRPAARGGQPTLLIVGNSLLNAGVDREAFTTSLDKKFAVALLPVENTAYEDWYFGLRRLFSEGARPSVVAVALTTRQMMSPSTDGEHFARLLMRRNDVLAVKRESRLDNTMTSAYFFANGSEWLGFRSRIRNWLLAGIFPGLERLTAFFPSARPAMPPPADVAAAVMPRLEDLDRLCRYYGARLVVIVPPTLADEAVGSAALQEAAKREGIRVLVPLPAGEVAAEDFKDGFHLNQRGAARFTPRLSQSLLEALAGDRPAPVARGISTK